MAKVKGKTVAERLRRQDVVKVFADSQNPIDRQVIDNLAFLTSDDKHKIRRDYQENGPTTGGDTLRECLIHRYNDQEELNLQQFIDGLNNIKHKQLKKALLSAYDTFQGCSIESVADERLTRIIKRVKDHYIKRFSKYTPSPLAEPFSIKDVWVNLSFSKGLSKLQSGHYLEMLRQAYKEKEDQFALLIGQPGEGKTMTMKRIAFDWANDCLSDYDLVLCVPLRDIQETSTSILDMALKNMQSHNILKEADVSHLQNIKDSMVGKPKVGDDSSDHLHVLIILDGYDEFSSEIECEELSQLLFNRDLRNLDYCVLVTSRPYAVEKVHAAAPKFMIEPLDEEQQTKYMFQHFKQESPNDAMERVTKLIDLLSQNPTLQQPAKTPLLLCFICILSNVLTPTDDSIQLYKLLFNAMVERYESTMSSMRRLLRRSMVGVFKQPFDNICGKSELIYNLGKMALIGLVGDVPHAPDKLQFTEDDLKIFEVDGDYCVKVGFLNVQLQGRFGEKIYEFPHKTMQEFFAALLLFHELSKCEEIKIVKDKPNHLIIKNGGRLFQRHPLLNQVFNTTKFRALEQLFSFVLEMSAVAFMNSDQVSHRPAAIANAPNIFQRFLWRLTGTQGAHGRRVSNTISLFLAWADRNLINQDIFLMVPILRTLLTHLSHCSEKTEIYHYLKIYLYAIIHTVQYDSQSLLWHFFTCNIFMYRVGDVCIYIPDLYFIFIVDQSSINQNILSHSIPISYEQLKTKCSSQLMLCYVDFPSLQILSQVCEATECEEIVFLAINITGISSAINQSNSELLKQKLQVNSVRLTFEETVKSPFDLMPVWNSCGSLFTNISVIRIESNGNNLQVIGLDQIFGQSVRSIHLRDISFPNEQTVVLLAEQLKKVKSLKEFVIANYMPINEQYLFILLESVKEAGVSNLQVTEGCLQQTETFHKFCSLLEQWHHLQKLDFRGTFLSSDLIGILCNTLSQLPDLEVLHLHRSDVKEKTYQSIKTNKYEVESD